MAALLLNSVPKKQRVRAIAFSLHFLGTLYPSVPCSRSNIHLKKWNRSSGPWLLQTWSYSPAPGLAVNYCQFTVLREQKGFSLLYAEKEEKRIKKERKLKEKRKRKGKRKVGYMSLGDGIAILFDPQSIA